jgi:hypothetical protein
MPDEPQTSALPSLWKRIRILERELRFDDRPYPVGLRPFPKKVLPGQGFFPGGDGLWREHPKETGAPGFPYRGVMIVGNDFGLADNDDPRSPGFDQCLEVGFEDPPTWGIKELIREARLPRESCFFTNAYLGLRAEGPIKGPSPGLKDSRFLPVCRSFFEYQLEIQRPRLVVLLGHEVRKFVAPASRYGIAPLIPELRPWRVDQPSFAKLDRIAQPLALPGSMRAGIWQSAAGTQLHIVFFILAHPSYAWSSNAQYPRAFGNLEGQAAETAMLAEAWHLAQGN